MIIAEELLLLTTTESGRPGQHQDLGVAGALLSELAARERMMLDARGRVTVTDSTSTGDDVLDEALLRIGERAGKKPQDVLSHLGKGMTRRLHERLSRAEVVQERPVGVLGLRLWSAWPLVDTRHRDEVREEILRVLTGAAEPDHRTGTLVSLVQATQTWGTALPRDHRAGLTGRQINRRSKEVMEGRWGGEAVARAVQQIAGAAAAAAAAGAAAGAGSG